MKIFRFILPVLFLSFFSNCIAQTGNSTPPSFIQQNVDSIYQTESLPGIFVGILNNEKKQFFNAGFAIPDKQMQFDSNTMFEIGSITKTFTAYILTSVLLENKILETDPIIKYLPDSVQQNKNLGNINFLSLMNHTSGLPRLPGNLKMKNARLPYDIYSSTELFAYLKTCTPKSDGKSNYSNLGAGIAGVLAERISGRSYAALLDKYIFIPFKMPTPVNSIEGTENKSQGYFAKDDKTPYWNMNILAPAGGLKCSGAEMLIYLQNMCFPVSKNSLSVINKLIEPSIILNERQAIGRGWQIVMPKDYPNIYWHNGGTSGFSTFCAFAKGKSKAVIIVINLSNKNAIADGLGFKIMKRLLSEE